MSVPASGASALPKPLEEARAEAGVDLVGPARAGRRGRASPLWHSKKIVLGLVIVGFFVVLAVVGPYLAPYDPSAIGPNVLQGPSSAHWLGTTESGQDVLSQVLVGARTSMVIGAVAAAVATVISVLVGISAGYLGGLSDDVLTAFANIILVIPALPLVIVLAGYLPNKGSLSVAIVISVTGWAWGARVLRAQTLSIRHRDYVEAARATGERTWRIILAEILPNNVAIIASGFLFTFIFAILTQASLAFLGLANISQWTWGTILYWAQNYAALNLGAWWWFVPPGLCVALLGMGLALTNFGIDEYINPRLRAAVPAGKSERLPPAVPNAALPALVAPDAGDHLRPPVLEIRSLSVSYGELRAVSNVDLTLHRGELLGLAGESGSGKSTLAYAFTRLLRPPGQVTSGQVLYHRANGAVVDILALGEDELRALRWQELAMVFQSAMNALNPVLAIATQLTDVLEAHRPEMARSERLERAAEMLRTVGISPDRLESYPHQLSGGMRQRVMIAMALLLEPEIVVMDEPTTALDVVIQRGILQEIDRLRSELGFSVVFITHDLSLLTEMADRIAIMYAGRTVEVGSARDLYSDPLHPYSEGLRHSFPPLRGPRRALSGIPGSPPDLRAIPAGCAFHPRCPHAMAVCSQSLPPLESYQSGDGTARLVACWWRAQEGSGRAPVSFTAGAPAPEASTTGTEPVVLEAVAVQRYFRVRRRRTDTGPRRVLHAVDGVSVQLRAGSVVALVGESGSGKSTLARLLAQLQRPTSGEVRLKGKPVHATRGRALRRYSGSVQYIFQDPFASSNPVHTVRHHLARALLVHGAKRNELDERLAELLDLVHLSPAEWFLPKFPHELSGGQLQRIGIARALAGDPVVLLADEPVSMLDVSIRLGVLNLLRELQEKRRLAILYVTHDMASARYFAQTTLVMYAGQLVEAGPSEEVVQSPAHPYTRLLLEAAPDPDRQSLASGARVNSEPPRIVNPAPGCRFAPRCPHAMEICTRDSPPSFEVGPGRRANCWLHAPAPARSAPRSER